jgi:hypothetical protein
VSEPVTWEPVTSEPITPAPGTSVSSTPSADEPIVAGDEPGAIVEVPAAGDADPEPTPTRIDPMPSATIDVSDEEAGEPTRQ